MSWYTDAWAWSNTQQSLDSMYLRKPSNVMDLFSLAVGRSRKKDSLSDSAQKKEDYTRWLKQTVCL